MGLRLLVVICLIGGVFAGSILRETIPKCSIECHPPQNPKFVWQMGKSYVFNYKSKNSVIFAGNEKETSSIEGIVELQGIDSCNFILRMKDLTVKEKMSHQEMEDFKTKLKLPLVISHNDHDLKNVCPSPEESTQSLNIKRSIAVSMANTMSRLNNPEEVDEYDTLGKCHTKYTVEEGYDLVIKKEKDLKTCTNRPSFISDIPKEKLPFSFLFETESVECKQYVDGTIMKRSACKEVRKMKMPFKDQNSLIEFSGLLEMDLTEINPGESFHHQLTSREELQLNLEESRPGDSSVKKVEKILLNLCLKNMHTIDMNINSDFMKLSSYTKVLSYEEIDRIYESLKSGKLCSSKKVKDLFVDTLPVVGTDAAVKFIARLIENQDLTVLKAKLFPASFALIPKPTKDTVAAVTDLVKNHPSTSVILGVTAMIYQLCSSENCDKISSVAKVVTAFDEYLGTDCSSGDEKKILTALKAFGNMGYHGKAQRNIIKCAKKCSKSNKVRLAAIESFRRIDKKRPDEFLQIYSNMSEDYEVRIAAFASLVKHADEQQLQQISEVVEIETDEEVSSYVYSLQKNMDKTSFPSKQKTRKLLQNLKIPQPNGNYWENSKQIEVSGFSKLMTIGGAIETDIIQDPNTKIPRSISTRLDLDLFNRNFKLLEVGVRANKLEEMVNKLIGLKKDLSKKKLRDLLGTKNGLLGVTNAELSLFVRVMDTDVFDLSTSDLIALKKVVNVAEIMNKLGREKDFDLSHSFVFMNSKLVLPSTTGRSYSIDLIGSSTVGLTASSKVDLMSLPHSADVQLQFQPSMNVEISTSVGMQSNYHKPEVKIASRLHFESDLKASFRVKDGHAVLAKLTLPSDDIMAVKMSTEMLLIDDNNNAKSVFDKTQKKIDHCFRKLEKPLGISACATVEVPKPLVVNTFPYILPFGNAEFALKKSDIFRSYEIQLEVPKHSGEVLKYKASLDTPGSRVKRRFAADCEVTQRKGHNEFVVQLTSPFKSIGGSGSYTRRENSSQGALELHADSVQVFSSNFTSKLMSSRGRKSWEASSSFSYMGSSPTQIDGFISSTKGRKHHLSFDFKANKPTSRPFRLKGSLTKEGRPTLSLKSEWKLSSDILIVSPFGDAKGECKVWKKVQSISGNLGFYYEMIGMEKQAITFSGTSQASSEKMNTNANFQMSQYPDANWYLNWNMQKQSTKNFKNDILLKYGRYPEKDYVHINQNSSINKSGHGRCTAFLEIPSLNVMYNVTTKYDLDFSEIPKIHVDTDICYKENKHIKVVIDVKYESRFPLKANGKIEVEYPGRHYIFEEKIAQTSNNVTEGNLKFQYEEGKIIELMFKVQTLGNDSTLHYEIESSFQTQSSPNPIKNKVSLQLNRGYLILTGDLISKYSLEANFQKAGLAQISLKSSKLEGKIEAVNEIFKKRISLDLKLNARRHIKALAVAEFGDKKQFHLEIVPSFESEPDKKILISSNIDIVKNNNSRNYNKNASHLVTRNQSDLLSLKPHDVSYNGRQEFHLMSSIKNFPPISLSYKAELNDGFPKLALNFSQNLVEKAKIEFDGSVLRNDKKQEFSFKTLALSPDNSFENLAITLNHKISHSESSTMMESLASFKKKAEVYKVEWNSDLQPHKFDMKAKLLTPHENFKKQGIGFSFKQQNNEISSSINIETPDDKLVSLVTEFQKKTHGYSAGCTLNSPFDIVRDVQAQMTIESHENGTEVEAYIDVNSARITELESSITSTSEETNIVGSLRLMHLPNIGFEGIHMQYKHAKTYMSVSGKIYLIDCKNIIVNSEIKDENGTMSATATIRTPYESLRDADAHISIKNLSFQSILICHIDVNGQRIIDAEIKVVLSSVSTEVQSRLKTIHLPEKFVIFKSEKMDESLSILIKVWNRTSSTTNGLPHSDEELVEANYPESILFDFKMSVSENNLKIYGMKASGDFPLVSVTFSINRNERSTCISELRVCQETQQTKCYSIMAYHKNMMNSDNYHFYKKFSIELKKFIDSSFEESLGGLNLLLSAGKYDFRSKMVFHLKEKSVGYDITVQRRRHENDRNSFDCKLYHPELNCRVASGILHNSNRTLFEIKFTREIDLPGRLFLIEIGREINHKTNEVSGFIKLANPNMSEPLQLISEFRKVGASVQSKLLILHNGIMKNVLIGEIIPNADQESTGSDSKRPIRKSLLFKLYTEDKTLDTSLMLTKQRSKLEDIVTYEWDFNSRKIHKKGAIVATLHRKSKSIRVTYFAPSTDSEVSKEISEDSGDAGLSLISHVQKIREIRIKTSGSCLDLDVLSSEPFIKGSFCVGKRSGKFLHLIKGDIYHRRRKSLDLLIDLDPKNPTFVNVSLKWKRQDLCQALKELRGRGNMLSECSIAEIKEQLKGNLEFFKKDILEPAMKELWIGGNYYSQDLNKVFRNAVKVPSVVLNQHHKLFKGGESLIVKIIDSLVNWKFLVQELVIPVIQAFKCSMQKNAQDLLKYLPDILAIILDAISERMQKCLEKYCVEGTVCHLLLEGKHFHRLKSIKNTLSQKLIYHKKSLEMIISKISMKEVVDRLKNDIATFSQGIGSSTFLSHKLIPRIGKTVGKIIPQKAINTINEIIKTFYDRLNQDEDFNAAKELISKALKQLNMGWRDKVRQIQSVIKENPKKLLQEQFHNLTYNPEKGELNFRIRQPLKKAEIEKLEKEMQRVLGKLQVSLDI